MSFEFGPRRGVYVDIAEEAAAPTLSAAELAAFESFDLVYRSLCALMFNYVPTSGHPGGSISSGHFVAGLMFDGLDYDVSRPDRDDADILSYAAGHKALGLYALWALRDELLRIAAPELLPADERQRLRLEDLLGFRRNPAAKTPLLAKFRCKALDGHPTPATPFVKLATGASGVGLASSLGLALGARDFYGADAPRVAIVEGEGGLTPGRVAEALAAAGTAGLDNAFVHLDWNQASIDSNRVCRDGDQPGDYVQWDPRELFHLHDWNVVYVADGLDFARVIAAQRRAAAIANGQPTAVVYRTVKGWRYGIEGRASHGAGHKLCSEGFYKALEPLTGGAPVLPTCEANNHRCAGADGAATMEECFWEALQVVRRALEERREMVDALAPRLAAAKGRLDRRARKPRDGAPRVQAVYELAAQAAEAPPAALALEPGTTTTLRGELGRALNHYNKVSHGALFAAAADLLGSTSVNAVGDGFPAGYWHAAANPGARLLSLGGICEDAMCGILAGVSTFGRQIGVGSSYGAFIAALGHVAARLHAIGAQARRAAAHEPYKPFVLVCAHAGLKTGEDGPTHADPQALQLLEGNFPPGTAITLTPWEPQEIWPLLGAAFALRPAVIAPFVTRPNEKVLDREALGLAPAVAAAHGLYKLRAAAGAKPDVTVVLQESGVTYAFVQEALPSLLAAGVDVEVFYVASAELFDALPAEERARIYPEETARRAMGITGFTLPTMHRWIRSERGLARTLHPFRKGHFLGSGQAEMVLLEAGLDGASQAAAVRAFLG